MTANEMASELELRLDRSDSFGSPGYEDFDVSSVLTEAQWLYIKKFYDEQNNRKRQGFEETEVRNQGLSALIKQGANLNVSVSQAGVLENGKFFDLPDDFMYTIYEEALIDKADCIDPDNSTWVFGDNVFAGTYAGIVGLPTNYPVNVAFTTNTTINSTFSGKELPESYTVGSTISITQDSGFSHTAYEGLHTIVEIIDKYTFVIDVAFAGSTPVNPGTVILPIKAWIDVLAHEEIWQYRYNKYKKPYYKNYGWSRIWRLVYQRETSGEVPASPATAKRHQLVTDGTFNITSYTMNYLINPPDIIVDRATPANQRNCILDESTNDVIIDIAKDLMLQRVREQKIQNIEPVKELE